MLFKQSSTDRDPVRTDRVGIRVALLVLATVFTGSAWAQDAGTAGQDDGSAASGGENGQQRDASELAPVRISADRDREDTYINEGESAQAGKTSMPIQDTPASVTVVEEQFMEDTGSQNIEDALRYSSGVYGQQYGFDTRIDSAAVRGLTPSRYLDGLREQYGNYNSVRPNLYALESVEVLKGPSSVLYGQAELGGIINAVSKLPQEEQRGELWMQLGSYDRTQVATDVTGPVNDNDEMFYRFVGLKRESGTQVDHVENNGYVLSPSFTWKPADGTELTLLVNRQVNEGQVSPQFLPQTGTLDSGPKGRIPPSTFVGEPGWDRYDREKTAVTFFLKQRLAEDWKVKATARDSSSSTQTREHWAAIGSTPNSNGEMPRTIHMSDKSTDVTNLDVRVEGLFDLGPTWHNLAVGVGRQDALWEEENADTVTAGGGMIDVYNPEYGNLQDGVLNPSDATDNEIKQTGVYFIDHMEIGNTVVNTALRRDEYENTELNPGSADVTTDESVTTGRVGLMYRFDIGASPYVSYSESYTPNLGTDGAGGTLDPTTGEQREAGVKYLSEQKDLAINLAWFDIEQQSRVQQGNTPGGVSQTGAVVDGWELQVKKQWSQFNVVANYTNLDARDDSTGNRLSAVVEEQGSVWGRYQFNNGVKVGLGSRYLGTRVGGGGAPEIPSVTLYDAMLGYSTGQWDFSVNAHNLTDEVYVSWCRGAGLDCGYGETRNVQANLRYNF